jgi:FkbM family methyltransferase
MKLSRRILGTISGITYGITREIGGAWRCSEDGASRLRLTVDILQSRLLKYWRLPHYGARRSVRLSPGLKVRYRLNRGDLQALREVMFEESYRPPQAPRGGVLVDLGANIGLTSLWLWKRFGFSKVIAVEPDDGNLAILRENFRLNGVPGTVVKGLVGPCGATALFQAHAHAVLGRVGAAGVAVDVVDLNHLLKDECVGLVKIDIEGAEQDLVSGNLGWLAHVEAIIAELHSGLIDGEFVAGRIVGAGFHHTPAGSLGWPNADFFSREPRQ